MLPDRHHFRFQRMAHCFQNAWFVSFFFHGTQPNVALHEGVILCQVLRSFSL